MIFKHSESIKKETVLPTFFFFLTVLFLICRSNEPLLIKKLTKWTLTSTSTPNSFRKRLLDKDNQAILSEKFFNVEDSPPWQRDMQHFFFFFRKKNHGKKYAVKAWILFGIFDTHVFF